jgi:hypothetical protein
MRKRHLIVEREIRRDKILELHSQDYSQAEISRKLGIALGTVHRNISAFEEFSNALISLNAIHKEAWKILTQCPDTKGRVQALGLALECLTKKVQLLANPMVLDSVKRYISSRADDFANSNSTGKDQDDYANPTEVDPKNGVF